MSSKLQKKVKGGFYLLKGTVWPYDVLVGLGVDRKQLMDYLKLRFNNALTPQEEVKITYEGLGFTYICENNAVIMAVKEFPTTPKQFGYLAHEIFHAADMILWKAGIKLTVESDESYAYLIDWMTREIYQAFSLPSKTKPTKK